MPKSEITMTDTTIALRGALALQKIGITTAHRPLAVTLVNELDSVTEATRNPLLMSTLRQKRPQHQQIL